MIMKIKMGRIEIKLISLKLLLLQNEIKWNAVIPYYMKYTNIAFT